MILPIWMSSSERAFLIYRWEVFNLNRQYFRDSFLYTDPLLFLYVKESTNFYHFVIIMYEVLFG